MDDFCVFILSYQRPDKVFTYDTLIKNGFTGKIFIIVDDNDKYINEYYSKFKEKVIVFNKNNIKNDFDLMDNFDNYNCVVYARNACWKIAENLGIKYFLQLDDDYTRFAYKKNEKDENINAVTIKNLDNVFKFFLDFFKSINAYSVAFSQFGDFIGGTKGNAVKNPRFRKCMNSFFCSKDRKFKFFGTLNEDVNVYTLYGSQGKLFLTLYDIALDQKTTQKNSGGLTDIYLEEGTYVKSFYSVMCMPSSVKISCMKTKHDRLHHLIKWNNTVPCIIDEIYKK